jgi:hypothetical protein
MPSTPTATAWSTAADGSLSSEELAELIRCRMHREPRRFQLRVLQRSADVTHRHLVGEAVQRGVAGCARYRR